MRTNIDIDNKLMAEALEVTGAPTKKAVIEKALIKSRHASSAHEAFDEMNGMGWDGDLDAIRLNWSR